MINFHLDPHSGIAPYLQIVHQVKHALRLGMLQPGDQLPTVREVVAQLAINPNTVLKAYRELEHDGLIGSRPGLGTFVLRGLAGPDSATIAELSRTLQLWLDSARSAGLDADGIQAIIIQVLHQPQIEETA
jgi:GntR family transcriptional regulator